MIRTVETKLGKIEGLPAADPRITSFKGIPFGVPFYFARRAALYHRERFAKQSERII